MAENDDMDGWRMTSSTGSAAEGISPAEIVNLRAIVDYGIVAGAELKLPVFVYLMRMAALELEKHKPRTQH